MTQNFDYELASFWLGSSDNLIHLESCDEFNRATVTLLQQARRKVYILTPDFEPERYNSEAFVDALTSFATRSRHSEARILVADPTVAIRWGHKVVNLGRRLTSKLLIRQLGEEDIQDAGQEAWIVADDIGLLRRNGTQDYKKGSLSAHAIPHAQRASQRFVELWERSAEVPDFRTLHI
jgi:hypothetical protein